MVLIENGIDWPERLAFQVFCLLKTKPQLEFRFHKTRRWRFDLAFVDQKLAVEVDGGGYVQGRHSRGSGIEKDCEKFAEAMVMGWRVLRVTPKHVESGQAVAWIQQLLSPSQGSSVA